MRATHTADVYGGKISLCHVVPDPANMNMAFGTVVRDYRGFMSHGLHTGSRVWIAKAQLTPND